VSFLDDIRNAVSEFRQEQYPQARNWLARKADLLGGAASDADAKKILHEQGNYNLTKKLANVVPPDLAANLADAAYLGNETFTGTLSKLLGKPFFSDYGFRWKDVAINRRGQDRAVNELLAKEALDRAVAGRTPYTGR
jgi:hypothetical protein